MPPGPILLRQCWPFEPQATLALARATAYIPSLLRASALHAAYKAYGDGALSSPCPNCKMILTI